MNSFHTWRAEARASSRKIGVLGGGHGGKLLFSPRKERRDAEPTACPTKMPRLCAFFILHFS